MKLFERNIMIKTTAVAEFFTIQNELLFVLIWLKIKQRMKVQEKFDEKLTDIVTET